MKARTLLPLITVGFALCLSATARADDVHCAGSGTGGEVKLVVQVAGVKAAQGEMAVTVYPDDSRRFLAPKGKLLRQRVPATAPVSTACFYVQPGVYAIAIYHDRNGNRDFDRNPAGYPTEGFAFSNDAPTRFGLPSFDAVRFRVPQGGRTMRTQIRYP